MTTCRGVNTPHDGDLTFFGKVMASLPLDIHITKLILLGHIFDVLEETIIMGILLYLFIFQLREVIELLKVIAADSLLF